MNHGRMQGQVAIERPLVSNLTVPALKSSSFLPSPLLFSFPFFLSTPILSLTLSLILYRTPTTHLQPRRTNPVINPYPLHPTLKTTLEPQFPIDIQPENSNIHSVKTQNPQLQTLILLIFQKPKPQTHANIT